MGAQKSDSNIKKKNNQKTSNKSTKKNDKTSNSKPVNKNKINTKKVTQKENNKKRKLLIGTFVVISLLLLIVGITYAYFAFQKTTEFGQIISGNLKMGYATGPELLIKKATPIYESDIDTEASYIIFSVENTGNIDMYVDISLEGITMSDALKTSDFKWSIEQGESLSEEGFNQAFKIESGTFETLDNSNSKMLVTNRFIEPNTTKYYRVRAWVEETGLEQNSIMGSNFKCKIKTIGYAKSKGRNFEDINPVLNNTIANRNISNLKLYGNSIQDTEPTIDSPVEINNVGDYDSTFGKYIIPITVSGKNIYNPATDTRFTLQEDGSYLSNARITTKKIIGDLKGIYTLSVKLKSPVGTNYRLRVYYTDGTYTDSYKTSTGDYLDFKITTNGKDIDEITWYYGSYSSNVQYKDFQIEKGDTATTYEPYQESISTNIYLDEPLKAIGKYRDYIDFENKKVVRKIATKSLTGTDSDNVQLFSSQSYSYNFISLGETGLVIDDIALSTHFTLQPNFSYSGEGNNKFTVLNSTSNNQSRIVFRIYKDNAIVSDITQVKSILSSENAKGTPVTFYYAVPDGLESSETIELPNITTLSGTTILSSNTTIPASFSGTHS